MAPKLDLGGRKTALIRLLLGAVQSSEAISSGKEMRVRGSRGVAADTSANAISKTYRAGDGGR